MQAGQQLKIGILNDLHYDGGVDAMNRLYEAVAMLNQGNIEFLVVLGDLIESGSEIHARRLLREVSALCDAFHGPVYFMPGNHDLDHLSKAQFYDALGRTDERPTFRFLQEGVEFIAIDGNFSPDGTEYDSGNFEWGKSCVPDEQLAWLKDQLDAAQSPVVLFSHQRIDVPGDFSVQNHDAVRDVIRQSGKVKAVFQGHQHADDMRQIDGTAYYTLAAHKEGAGPAVAIIDAKAIRLARDFSPMERVSA